MELIDTHCHLDMKEHFHQLERSLADAKSAGVGKIILPGVTQAGWHRMMELCHREQSLFAAPGLHPLYLAHHHPQHLEELEDLTKSPPEKYGRPVAIGEIGLDYYVDSVDRTAQQLLFEHQLKIAHSASLPILLHVRKAHDQVLATLRRKHFVNGGIVHAFNGSFQQACQYIKLGFGIGICGTITYDRSRKIRKVASQLPQESLVLETDAPDIPPAAHWGENNHPSYLPEILDALTLLRGEPREVTANYTSSNAKRILGLPD